MADSSPDDPRNEALAAEHAAVWTYGVLAATARRHAAEPGGGARDAFTRFMRGRTEHAAARDRLLAALHADRVPAVVAAASYPISAHLDTVEAQLASAVAAEKACADAYAWLISDVSGKARQPAIDALIKTVVRELDLRGTPETFPGAADLADRHGSDTEPH